MYQLNHPKAVVLLTIVVPKNAIKIEGTKFFARIRSHGSKAQAGEKAYNVA